MCLVTPVDRLRAEMATLHLTDSSAALIPPAAPQSHTERPTKRPSDKEHDVPSHGQSP